MKTGEIQHKAFSTNCKIAPDEMRTVVACISSIAVDRAGDVLIPQGMNSKDFEANPLVMLNHTYDPSYAVGKVTALKRTDDQVVAKIQFAARPESYPEDEEWYPETLFSLYQQGILNAFSVGFYPTDSRAANAADLRKYGEDCRQVINRWKLLELSCVAIGCQQEAVAQAVSKGLAEKLFAKETVPEPTPKTEEKAEEKASEQAPCSKCGDMYPVTEMSMMDDEYVCSACASDEKGEEAKEIIREIVAAKRIVTAVETAKEDVPCVKHVNRFIPPDQKELDRKAYKIVVRTVSKLRGKIYCD